MKKIVVFVVCCFAFCQWALGGIYRHDKPEAEYVALAAEPQFDCVGRVYYGHAWDGSCVLVGSRYVLTAAHVVIEAKIRKDTLRYDGKIIIVNQPVKEYVKDAAGIICIFNGKKYKGQAVHVYPEYLDSTTKSKCDIALIELTEPVADIKPAVLCRSFDELGAAIVGVGYGGHGIADQPENIVAAAKKIAGQNIIDSLCGYKVNGAFVSMLCDFDHPTKPAHNRMGSSAALPLEYITTGGDSGGGAFRKTANGWELVGICGGSEHGGVDIELLTTKGIGYYDQVMEWQRVSVFAEWIDGLMR